MANDWIRMRLALQRDPRVRQLARLVASKLSFVEERVTERNARNATCATTFVLGALCVTWFNGREQARPWGEQGAILRRFNLGDLDELVGFPGWGECLLDVGLIEQHETGIVLPNFKRHNDLPTMTAAERQQLFRDREKAKSKLGIDSDEVRVTKRNARNAKERKGEKRRVEDLKLQPSVEANRASASPSPRPAEAGPVDPPAGSDARASKQPRQDQARAQDNGPASEKPPAPIPPLERYIRAVVEHYQTYHPQACRSLKPTSPEWRKISDRLCVDEFTVDELRMAIDGCHLSPHHCGQNDQGTKYQSLELIVRDRKHVDQFIAIVRNPPRAPALSKVDRSVEGIMRRHLEEQRRQSRGGQPSNPFADGDVVNDLLAASGRPLLEDHS